MRPFVLLVPVLALAACVEAVPPPVDEPDPDACKASQYQGLVGQPRSVITDMTFPAGTRVIEPGAPITADFRFDRLNIEIGANGRIDKIGCF